MCSQWLSMVFAADTKLLRNLSRPMFGSNQSKHGQLPIRECVEIMWQIAAAGELLHGERRY